MVPFSMWAPAIGMDLPKCTCGDNHLRLHVFRDPLKPRCTLCPACKHESPLIQRKFSGLRYRAPKRTLNLPVPTVKADLDACERDPYDYTVSEFEMAGIFPEHWMAGSRDYNYQDSSDIRDTSELFEPSALTALQQEIETTIDQDVYPQTTVEEAEPSEEAESSEDADSSEEAEPSDEAESSEEAESDDDAEPSEEADSDEEAGSSEEADPVEQHETSDHDSDSGGSDKSDSSVVTVIHSPQTSQRFLSEPPDWPEARPQPLEVRSISFSHNATG